MIILKESLILQLVKNCAFVTFWIKMGDVAKKHIKVMGILLET
jgi:hypothetical protein